MSRKTWRPWSWGACWLRTKSFQRSKILLLLFPPPRQNTFRVNSSKSLLIPRLAQQETDAHRRSTTLKQVSKVPITLSNCCRLERNINFFIGKINMNWNVMARANWIGEQKLAGEGSVEFKSNNSLSTGDLAFGEKFSYRGPSKEPQDLQLRHFS